MDQDVNDTDLSTAFHVSHNNIMRIRYREAKLHAAPISLVEVIPEFGSIYAAKCNCNASKVAVIVNKVRTI